MEGVDRYIPIKKIMMGEYDIPKTLEPTYMLCFHRIYTVRE